MAKSIEKGIRFKAAMIYTIVAIGVVAMILYLHTVRKEISSQRVQIERQHTLLSVTNDLIFTVGGAQSAATLYLSTKNRTYLTQYSQFVDSVERLVDTIILLKPNEEEKLHKIGSLLRKQAQNITRLNAQLAGKNPVEVINERLQDYEPQVKEDTLHVVTIQRDTVIREAPKKGFFKRIKEVFKPSKDTVRVVVNQRTDTIRTTANDSIPIISEVGDIAQKAQKTYDQNIRTIEKQIGELIVSNKDIATEISGLLLELHRETFNATRLILINSEEAIARNYVYSTIGGILALVLILVFIGLIITDINKGRRARQELEKANENIRQVMESRHKLLLSVSHDIKSPLNSIMGYLELMENDDRVRSMHHSSQHILSMLENLLEFSSLEQGTLQKNTSEFNLKELFWEVYEMFLPLAGQKELSLLVEADDCRICTDRVKVKQIIINLVSNGIKYTQNGAVVFRGSFCEEQLKIEVADTGAGIPAAKLPQLFRPFSRIEENNAMAAGTGLGMFVVKGLTALLDGNITLESVVGKGTTITITLPAAAGRKPMLKGAKKVRVYDDDPTIVKIVSELLERLGHRVVENDPDLILTDMEMGAVSGRDILAQANGVPVVVMTGRSDFSDALAAEMGFCGFLAKPFTIESLREIIGTGETFEEWMGDDYEEIMELFRTSAKEHSSVLAQALADNDFPRAQAVCHKMLPMFAQLGYPTEELRKMDTNRGKEYENWQKDAESILSIKV